MSFTPTKRPRIRVPNRHFDELERPSPNPKPSLKLSQLYLTKNEMCYIFCGNGMAGSIATVVCRTDHGNPTPFGKDDMLVCSEFADLVAAPVERSEPGPYIAGTRRRCVTTPAAMSSTTPSSRSMKLVLAYAQDVAASCGDCKALVAIRLRVLALGETMVGSQGPLAESIAVLPLGAHAARKVPATPTM